MLPLVTSVGLLAAGALAHGALHRNSPLFGRVLSQAGPGRRIALTFDDGPNPRATPAILDALGDAGVAATFFVLGRHADRWPGLVERTHHEGHLLANHGWHHRKLHLRSPRWVRDDIAAGARAVERAAGVATALFRAPHGFRAPWVVPTAHALAHRVVGWSLGVWDSATPGVDTIIRRTVEGVRPGSIVLLHDGDGYDPAGDRMQTAAALPAIIRELRARGYEFVTLADA